MELPVLNAEEIRVLGSLMEKSRTTPEYYPMTINAITTACNQKTSRKPVVNYSEDLVMETIDSLKKKGLVSTMTGAGSRTTKYKHNISVKFPIMPSEWTALTLLMLRGPLTAGEINNLSGRMYEYESIDEVLNILQKLASEKQDHPQFVIELPKKPGQKERRFAHLLGGKENIEIDYTESSSKTNHNQDELIQRIDRLEEELHQLRQDFDNLMKQLT